MFFFEFYQADVLIDGGSPYPQNLQCCLLMCLRRIYLEINITGIPELSLVVI